MYAQWESQTFEVQGQYYSVANSATRLLTDRPYSLVANHELIGHGSGKLLTESKDGKFNFDRSLVNPLTGKPVESWYKPGETPASRLGAINGTSEEMRAEAVAVFCSSSLLP